MVDKWWSGLDPIHNVLSDGRENVDVYVRSYTNPLGSLSWEYAIVLSSDDGNDSSVILLKNGESERLELEY